jgi:hypothetical protein
LKINQTLLDTKENWFSSSDVPSWAWGSDMLRFDRMLDFAARRQLHSLKWRVVKFLVNKYQLEKEIIELIM